MQTEFSADQIQFREVVARFMEDKSPTVAVRELMATETGYDVAVWRQLSEEVGLAGTHIPERYGGFGFGPVELGIVAEQMGKALYCGPFLASSVMAGQALLNGGDEAVKEGLLPEIAAGTTIATLVLDDVGDRSRVGHSLRVTGADDALTLTGVAGIVLDAHVAGVLVVVAAAADGLRLVTVAADAPGVTVTPLTVLDPTRKLCRVAFADVAVSRAGQMDDEALQRTWDELCTALAHEMIGGAQVLLDSTVEYTKMRYQFGRAIGSFQALKHRCADMLLELELAKAATYHAARCLDAGGGEPWAPSMAKAMASDAYMSIARGAIQLRGGIGFTWENDTHLWFKRAKSSEVFLGAPHVHRERMMQLMEEVGSE